MGSTISFQNIFNNLHCSGLLRVTSRNNLLEFLSFTGILYRILLKEILKVANELRPKVKWGFAGLPYCEIDGELSGNSVCNLRSHNVNDG